ncbi:MAG TPA: hypothetical protein VHE83_00870 [Mycobacteriales bacterium]|nr:hypothetical protein [Mycobacteriales bacterium]
MTEATAPKDSAIEDSAPEESAPADLLSEEAIEEVAEKTAADVAHDAATPPPAPTGIKAQAMQVALKGFMKLPPPAQQGVMKGAMTVGPVIAKAAPHMKKVLAGTGALVVLRKVRHRGK